MNDKETQIYITRIDRFIGRIAGRILGESIPFEASYAVSKDPVKFDQRLNLSYCPISEGDLWGRAWNSAWFNLKASVPDSWTGSKIAARLDFSGEGLVYAADGDIVQGITNGSVFDAEFSRDIVHLIDCCQGGEQIDLWVEAAANGLFGVFTEPDPPENSPRRYGHYDATVKSIRLCRFHEDIWHLWLDLKILAGLIKKLPEKSVRRSRIIKTVNDAIDVMEANPDNIGAGSRILRRVLDQPAAPSDLSVLAVGHAHIDTAWLWPISESIRKCARTFSSQIALIDKYPEYVFGASQPQHYAFVKEHYPRLYDKIKQAVKSGRWEPQGGMWVEADCNLISGESMIRQILHGKNFFMDEFGVDVKNLWLPDVFGYSAAMPQILKKSGIDFFLTQKLSWSQFNEFPHHSFIWRGIDGSEVLTHFPPENTYNSQLGTDYLVPARDTFKERHFIDEFISLFGVGDGGGGPKEENIELGRRMTDLEGSPRVRFGTAAEFFDGLKKHEDSLATWVGELYLELHRGTLTTQAKVKKANRCLEQKLQIVECLWAGLDLKDYPAEALDGIWKKMMMHQFHDILPGSSITRAYRVTHADHADLINRCDELTQMAAGRMFEKDEDSLVLFNCLPYRFEGPLTLPDGWHNGPVADENDNIIPTQKTSGGVVIDAAIEPYSFLNLKRIDGDIETDNRANDLTLENDLVRYEFETDGSLKRAWDKELEREIIPAGEKGNALTLYDDHPNNWDAWDIDLFYEKSIVDRARAVSVSDHSGNLRRQIRFNLTIGRSKIVQDVGLDYNSRRLDFKTTIDWVEKHKMLRVAFPVNIRSDKAGFDIQYGYVERPTHRNTSWDVARFEVPAHRYADLSDNDYGVALLNDCKYGYKVYDSVLDLNLLRSTTYPDPDADQGRHEFTYSLLPHRGDLIHSDVIRQSAHLNRQPLVFTGYRAKKQYLPWQVTGEGIVLEVVKKAEKEDCLILRIVETMGRSSSGVLTVDNPGMKLVETDLMEWREGKALSCKEPVSLQLQPFEIRTYKLKGC